MPGIVGAVIGVERVDAGLFQKTHYRNALLKAASPLGVVLAGQNALIEARGLARDAVTHKHREVAAAGCLNPLDHVG